MRACLRTKRVWGRADGYDKSHGDCSPDLSHRNQPDLSWPLANACATPMALRRCPSPSSGPRDLWPSPTNTLPLTWTPASCLHAGRDPHDPITVTGTLPLPFCDVWHCSALRLSRIAPWRGPSLEGHLPVQAASSSYPGYRLSIGYLSSLLSIIPLQTPY